MERSSGYLEQSSSHGSSGWRKATISFNKVRFDGHLELFWLLVFNSLSAGLGGEGRRCSDERLWSSSRWWGSQLQSGVHYMVAKISTMISGQGGHSKRCFDSVL
jgi:hypothetical protein